jgi:4-amino-4-deoxy-L-arabinose transferase-like glycosyltransferase
MLAKSDVRPEDRRFILALILVATLFLRLGLALAVQGLGIHTDDERDYTQLADSLVAGRGYEFANGAVTSIRPPLYPAFVASVWKFSGTRSLTAVRLAQIAVSMASVWLVFALARRMFGDRTGLVAAAVFAFYPSYLYANVLLLTEVVFTFFVLLACVCVAEAVNDRRRLLVWAGCAGLAVGLGALTRSVLWPLPLVLIPTLMWMTGPSWRTRWAVALCAAAGYCAVVAPWSMRNTRLQGTFVVVDTMGGMNLRMGNYEHTREDRMWDGVALTGEQSWSHALVQQYPDATTWTEGQREKWARARATEYMIANPVITLRRAVLKFADFWGLEREYIAAIRAGTYRAPGWFLVTSSVAVLVSYVVTMLLAAAGLFLLPWSDWKAHVAPLLVVVWITGLHTVVFGHSRYHLPLMPLLIVYAAAALNDRSWLRFRVAPRRRWAIAATWLVLALIWSHEVLIRDTDRIRQIIMATL